MKFNLPLLSAGVVSACMLFATPLLAAEKHDIALVAKVTGIPGSPEWPLASMKPRKNLM